MLFRSQLFLQTVVTVILQQKLDDKTRLKWEEFSSDHDESVPPCIEFVEFLDFKVRQLESVSCQT